jgi:hypothetical protein
VENERKRQEELDLSAYADEIIEANREAFLMLANEEEPQGEAKAEIRHPRSEPGGKGSPEGQG